MPNSNSYMQDHFYRKEMRHRFRRWMMLPTCFMVFAYGSAILAHPEAPINSTIFWLWIAWAIFCKYKFSGQGPRE